MTTKLKQFKLVRGIHRQGGVTYASKDFQKQDKSGNTFTDIVESETDLAASLPHKFISLEDAEAMESETELDDNGDPKFSEMTVADLKAFADENDIDLDGASTKGDILQTVLDAWNGND